MDEQTEFNVSAPWSWNARYFVEHGCARTGGVEFLLYSDTGVTGDSELACHPYLLTNSFGFPEKGRLAPVLALYLDDHFPDLSVQPMDKTDVDGWLNLTLDDEVACMLSLVAGVRLRSGGRVRRFTHAASRGVPEFYGHRVPEWPATERPIYPVPKQISMDSLDGWMGRYLALGREDAVALVRAARQFRDALWVADTDPELAWLFLVSALEVIAGREALSSASPADLLHQEKPALAAQLLAVGGEAHLEAVAQELVGVVRATARFLSCVKTHLPGPPAVRPEIYAQVDWAWPKLRKQVAQVYDYRSRRLHGGVPFPSPLCQVPFGQEATLEERPTCIASASGNAAWLSEDLPMHLHTFGYIVRGCLLDWWQKASRSADGEDTQVVVATP
ncbi:hypothetical protein [Streptomyces prunicolor]|uniref:Apea-like HEPN domain-containing protein n=1 Tax=Streptomyces prunicolor TaxID=67348 RepID=A0ABU4FRJ6_9ACTN|nr:hypothetical protein [Streptomyces prunicolor]MDV7222638.1 hypothetical protein [Streptomyces prunicolor]